MRMQNNGATQDQSENAGEHFSHAASAIAEMNMDNVDGVAEEQSV